MQGRRRGLAVGIAVAAVVGGALPGASPAAWAASTHPPIIASIQFPEGGPLQQFADGAAVHLDPDSSAGDIQLDFDGSAFTPGVAITAPEGRRLRAGRWSDIRTYSDDPTRPSVHMGLEPYDGDLDILDIAANPDGSLKRFDIVFRSKSRVSADGFWGELRMGEPDDSSRIRIGTRHIVFPRTPKGSRPMIMVETLHNTSAQSVRIGTAALQGRSATSYGLSNDHCSGTVLRSGRTCTFRVGFSPRGGGPLVATLKIPIGGRTETVQVAGEGELGTSQVSWSVGGETTTFASGPYQLIAIGPQDDAAEADHEIWYVRSTARYDSDPPSRFDLSASGDTTSGVSGFRIAGTGLSCSSDTVSSVAPRTIVRDSIGRPTRLDLDFTLTCPDGPQSDVHGTIQYQNRSDVTPPARVAGLRVSAGATRTVSWSASTDATRTTIARLIKGDGANATATSGYALSSGDATSARLPALTPRARYVVAVFTVDRTGNTSAPVLASLVG